MESKIIELLIEFAAHILLLTAALWVMIKLQGFNYNFPGLLGTAVVGGGLDMVPFVGHVLAVPALYFCIWKMTRASVFPDCAFTVAVGYALMFAFNVLVLTALMGDLRPDLRPAADNETNSEPTEAIIIGSLSNNAAKPLVLGTNGASGKPESPAVTKARATLKQFTISGVTHNGNKSAVLMQCRNKNYDLYLGQPAVIPTDSGFVHVTLSAMDTNTYTLNIDGTPIVQVLP